MRLLCTLLLGTAAVIGTGFALTADEHQTKHAEEVEMPKLGVALLVPTKDNKARGMLRLVQSDKDLQITGRVNNLSPGEHGFHIHEFGDLRSPDGTSAGGHFNPRGHEHGAPGEESHMGDLGNITAGEDGVARVNVTVKDTPLHFILGRSLVVHGGEDDFESQPAGDAGPRVAIGVIGVANPDVTPRHNRNQQ